MAASAAAITARAVSNTLNLFNIVIILPFLARPSVRRNPKLRARSNKRTISEEEGAVHESGPLAANTVRWKSGLATRYSALADTGREKYLPCGIAIGAAKAYIRPTWF